MEKYMIIDGSPVEFTDEKNMLAVIRKAGIDLPTFCYYSDLSTYGACRMCVVEDEWGGIIASCSTPPKHKAVIKTNTPKLYKHRKMILELLLSAHCRDCTACEKNGCCSLQELAQRFGIRDIIFPNNVEHTEIDNNSPALIRDAGKCILCGDCVRMCHEIQNVGVIDFVNRGSEMMISTAFGKKLSETNCVNCGQCAAVCPTGAITIKHHTSDVWKALYDPKKRVVAQIAPAVRVAIGEQFGLEPGENTLGKIVAALHRLGFDQVYDTSVGADLTIMEEAAELVDKMKYGKSDMPLFTSCCPGWVRYAETQHPELMPHVSSCKSPMQMLGAAIKAYYKDIDHREEKETVSVAIMPCTAKKFEVSREEFVKDGVADTDYAITTTELIAMIKQIGIVFNEIEEESPDMKFGLHSGSGEIFGVTGGVTEAAVRRVVSDKSPKALKEIEFMGLRGMKGVKTCEIDNDDLKMRIAVVSGLANAESLIQKIESGEEHFDFVEVMACPGGCVSGAGQPFASKEVKEQRGQGLYRTDRANQIKRSEENPLIIDLYDDLLKNREHDLLHVHYGK